jgi:hypothetical protein
MYQEAQQFVKCLEQVYVQEKNHSAVYVQENANDACDRGGPVVSHMWLFSVGYGHTSHEIWWKSVQGFCRYVQTT